MPESLQSSIAASVYIMHFEVESCLDRAKPLKKDKLDGNPCFSTRDVSWNVRCQCIPLDSSVAFVSLSDWWEKEVMYDLI